MLRDLTMRLTRECRVLPYKHVVHVLDYISSISAVAACQLIKLLPQVTVVHFGNRHKLQDREAGHVKHEAASVQVTVVSNMHADTTPRGAPSHRACLAHDRICVSQAQPAVTSMSTMPRPSAVSFAQSSLLLNIC